MEPARLRNAVGAISSLCAELVLLRRRRTGSRTAAGLREELERLNRAVNAGTRHVMTRKLELLDHDSLARELGMLKEITVSASQMLSCPEVQDELAANGFSAEHVSLRLHNCLNRVQRLRQALSGHEKLVRGLLRGVKASNADLERLERLLVSVNEWEERIEKEQKIISSVAAAEEKHPLHRVAAGIVLPVASAAGLVLSHSDLWA